MAPSPQVPLARPVVPYAADSLEHLLCWEQYLGADAVAQDQDNAVMRRHAVDCSRAARGVSQTQSGSSL
jgi:hypothetical protein